MISGLVRLKVGCQWGLNHRRRGGGGCLPSGAAAGRQWPAAKGLPCLARRGKGGGAGLAKGGTGYGRHGARGGACAVPLHGEALRQRKAPHGAGLVRVDGRRGFMPAAAAAGSVGTFRADQKRQPSGGASTPATALKQHGRQSHLAAMIGSRTNAGNPLQGLRSVRRDNPIYTPARPVRKRLP